MEHTQVQVKESGHWYTKTGNPAYTQIAKDGNERPTTLRDARKLDLVPSVTSIIRLAAAPGLEKWKKEQLLMSALTCTRIENEPEANYIARIIEDAEEQSRKARERGTLIHAYVQSGFEGAYLEGEGLEYYQSARKELDAQLGPMSWECEKSFCAGRYGGKVDLQNTGFIIDIKTTDKPIDGVKTWPEHAWQLAAYDYDNNTGYHGILYVSTLTKESKLILIDAEEIEQGRKCFNALLDFYYAKTGL